MRDVCRLLVIGTLISTLGLAAEPEARMTSETFTGLELRNIGPALMSGRISDIVKDPTDPSTWYVAVSSGGVWKTTNAATTWQPIFDGESSHESTDRLGRNR